MKISKIFRTLSWLDEHKPTVEVQVESGQISGYKLKYEIEFWISPRQFEALIGSGNASTS